MTHPVDLPGAGVMKFPKNRVSKEELLEFWQDIRVQKKLRVQEGTKFESLQSHGNYFTVKTNKGQITAKKVILCMGVRGSPRRLGLPNETLPKVTYNLIDPEQYQRNEIAVVGGGNAAVEAAQYLADKKYQNKVKLLVRGAAFDRCNETNRNKINEMAEKGLVEILYNASVTEITMESLTIMHGNESKIIKNDYLFIFAGADLPTKFLMSLGIEIEKKFGTSL